MTRNHEKLLVAALAGIIIAGAAVFAIQPAMAQPTAKAGITQPSVAIETVLTLRLGSTL
ncbi:MAG TPA: hypothetical protein VFE52_05295 [Devosia sp.]|jgi:hypothetical protein|nr:hypothetical protein [Devosia sp.]